MPSRRVESVALTTEGTPVASTTIELEGLLERVSQAERDTAVRIAELEQAGTAHTRSLDERIVAVLAQLEEAAEQRAGRRLDNGRVAAHRRSRPRPPPPGRRSTTLRRAPVPTSRPRPSPRAPSFAGASAGCSRRARRARHRGVAELDEASTATREGIASDTASMRTESESIRVRRTHAARPAHGGRVDRAHRSRPARDGAARPAERARPARRRHRAGGGATRGSARGVRPEPCRRAGGAPAWCG